MSNLEQFISSSLWTYINIIIIKVCKDGCIDIYYARKKTTWRIKMKLRSNNHQDNIFTLITGIYVGRASDKS